MVRFLLSFRNFHSNLLFRKYPHQRMGKNIHQKPTNSCMNFLHSSLLQIYLQTISHPFLLLLPIWFYVFLHLLKWSGKFLEDSVDERILVGKEKGQKREIKYHDVTLYLIGGNLNSAVNLFIQQGFISHSFSE